MWLDRILVLTTSYFHHTGLLVLIIYIVLKSGFYLSQIKQGSAFVRFSTSAEKCGGLVKLGNRDFYIELENKRFLLG